MNSEDIRELYDKIARTRYQFLRTELRTCITALEMAKYELSVGNFPVAEREVVSIEKGIRTIQRFLPEVSAEQRTELQARLADVKAMLDSLKAELSTPSP